MKFEKRSVFGWPATAASYGPCTNGLVVHYDGSRQGLAGKDHDACRLYWRNTRRFHMSSARNWADIGYSFAVCPHGVVMEGRGWQKQQAAQPGGNSTWTSCTFMSGDDEKPTAAQVNAFRELRAWLRGKGLGAAISYHGRFIDTSCPGDTLRGMVISGALAGAPSKEDDLPSVKEVWTADIIESPPEKQKEGNKFWTPASYLIWGYRLMQAIQAKVGGLEQRATAQDEKLDKMATDLADIKALLNAKQG